MIIDVRKPSMDWQSI